MHEDPTWNTARHHSPSSWRNTLTIHGLDGAACAQLKALPQQVNDLGTVRTALHGFNGASSLLRRLGGMFPSGMLAPWA